MVNGFYFLYFYNVIVKNKYIYFVVDGLFYINKLKWDIM